MDPDCDHGLCVYEPVLQTLVCLPICQEDPSVCPEGSTCLPFQTQEGSFVIRACSPTGSCILAQECSQVDCADGKYCYSGLCKPITEPCHRCTTTAPEKCGNGNYCVALPEEDGTTYCLQGCMAEGDDCGEGYSCQPVQNRRGDVVYHACFPESGRCTEPED